MARPPPNPARLPISAFYAQADWVNLIETAQEAKNCEKLKEALCLKKVDHLLVDKSLEEDLPFVNRCFSTTKPVILTYRDSYVKIYKSEGCAYNP